MKESHPSKIKQLFKSNSLQEDAEQSDLPLSLSDYIRRHIQDTQMPEESSAVSGRADSQNWRETFLHPELRQTASRWKASAKSPMGCRLNSLDTEMSAGIEHLLPTPAFRLRIAKGRLLREIAALNTELELYRSIQTPCPELAAKMGAHEKRLIQLQNREQQISRELEALRSGKTNFSHLPLFYIHIRKSLHTFFQMVGNALSPIFWIRRLYPKRLLLSEKMKQLEDLNFLLARLQEESRKQTTFSSMEVSDIVHQYDRCRLEVDALITHLEKKPGFRDKAGLLIWRTFRRLYT